jgi:hypothetical protein
MANRKQKERDVFIGRKKVVQTKTQLGDRARILENSITKIPKRIVEIDSYVDKVKKGEVVLNRENADSTFKDFIRENKGVLKVEADNLKMVSAKNINKKWYVKYAQHFKGIPVYKATVGIDSAEDGKVTSYTGNYHPKIDVPTRPKVKLEKATQIAFMEYDREDRKKLKQRDGTLMIYPDRKDDDIKYYLVWKIWVVGDGSNPELDKFFMVDALTAKIIHSYPARFPGFKIQGTVQGEIYPENPTDTVTAASLKHAKVRVNGAGTTITNDQGKYKIPVSWMWLISNMPEGEATFSLDGPYARVQNHDGSDYVITKGCSVSSSCNHTWTDTDRDHINLFFHMNLFHDWLEDELGYSWENPWDGSSKFNAEVNHSFANAYAGDPMLFGTDPFARSSDVIYHECTHNVLYEIYGDYIGWPSAYIEGYAMDEGFSDYFASSFTDDSQHGEGYTSSPRDLDNNDMYQGKANYNREGHTGGKLIGGAAWIFRNRLRNIFGEQGTTIADQLLLEAHQILSISPSEYFFTSPRESNFLTALYKAVDVDNNLMNGFPYLNEIQHAFHAHNLLQVILEDRDSFDFSTNTLGEITGGDLYFYDGKFWANNLNQKGVKSLGNIGSADLSTVTIPTSGYTRFGVNAVVGNTYISKAQSGENNSFIAFRVTNMAADKSEVTLEYFYHISPFWYIANTRTNEIHKTTCRWVYWMSSSNKKTLKGLNKVADYIRNHGYNGCNTCLKRYDTDTLTLSKVLENLDDDLA